MTVMLATQADCAQWQRDGVLLLRGLFSRDEILALRRQIVALYQARFGRLAEGSENDSVIVDTYVGDKSGWRQCARRLPNLPGLYRLAGEPLLLEVARKLGLAEPVFSTAPEVRVDMPNDAQYMQPWHQDWRYGQASFNSITLWTPLHDVRREHGALEVVKGSHLKGLLKCVELPNPRRFVIEDAGLEEAKADTVEVELGDTLVFSQLLAHRSGTNSSSRPRLSFQLRLADLAEKNFIDNGFRAPQTSELIWERIPTKDDASLIYGRT